MSTIDPLDVNKSNPHESRIHKCENDGSETSYEDYGGKIWYSMAKSQCCNFSGRGRDGYCMTLAEPYKTFRCKCNECSLGKDLLLDMTKNKKSRK
jgi:hypothetical protein